MTPILVMLLNQIINEGLDGYIINTSDEHGNEYIGLSDERLKRVTNFTGSNGLFLMTKNGSFLWTDGRYHIQAANELENSIKLVKERDDFFNIIKGLKQVGMNLKQVSTGEFANMVVNSKETKFVHLDLESVFKMPKKEFKDIINLENVLLSKYFNEMHIKVLEDNYSWFDSKIVNLDENVTGSLRDRKIGDLQEKISDDEIVVFTLLDEIAWLLNLRGKDIEYNPVFYAFVILTKNNVTLYAGNKIELEKIEVKDYYSFYEDVNLIKNKKVLISGDCNQYLHDFLSGSNKVEFDKTIESEKSKKNPHEIFGFIMAHIFDGISLCSLFEWMENTLSKHQLSELDVSNKLVEIKEQFKGYFSPSFETISATAENSAIIHHKGSTREIDAKELYLIDSGTQYYYGTTDVTRTLIFSEPNDEQRNDFTTVLKGQIDAMTSIIHKKYNSSILDTITRLPIWSQNEVDDFQHSTGHGVGHFLNVHESPPNISQSGKKLEENMIFSIEPGLYKEGIHGIRIEDLVIARSFSKLKFEFKNLTMAPLQKKMINMDILDNKHKAYLKDFNARVWNVLSKFIGEGEQGYNFLRQNTID